MSSALLIIERKEQILSLLYNENRLIQVNVHDEKAAFNGSDVLEQKNEVLPLGAIYIGKVKNVVPAIDAAFVEVTKGKMGFLPLRNTKNPIIVNRKFDGRILSGDEILVQIEKEGMKTKDPGLTCNLSFSGKYCVLTTGKHNIGFSTKLEHKTRLFWKQKLGEWKIEDILQKESTGMVLRTNVTNLLETVSEQQENVSNTMESFPVEYLGETIFRKEFDQLLEQKNKVLQDVNYRTCFSCLFRPLEGYLTDIRDTYESSFDKIVTDIPYVYERIRQEFPLQENVELYQDSCITLEKLYSVETRLKEALEEKVWLKSGAYLIIQQTEALTVIDVNSGKIQKKNPNDNIYFEINKEAAREIALQLRLRNLSGIIIVDFISQNTKEQDSQLLSYVSSLVKADSVKTSVIDMTPLGLVEITRKKIHKSLKEQLK